MLEGGGVEDGPPGDDGLEPDDGGDLHEPEMPADDDGGHDGHDLGDGDGGDDDGRGGYGRLRTRPSEGVMAPAGATSGRGYPAAPGSRPSGIAPSPAAGGPMPAGYAAASRPVPSRAGDDRGASPRGYSRSGSRPDAGTGAAAPGARF